jgi:multidrug efflux system membrane fusion protein
MNRRWVIAAAGLALVALGCGRQQGPMGWKPAPPVVSVAAAVTRDVPQYLDEIGTCTARQYVTVRPQVTGPITQIHFVDGAEVRKGDLLFTIDPRPYRAALDQAQANQRRDSATLDFAKIEWARMKELLTTKAVSQDDYDTKKNAYDVAVASLGASDAAVESARLNLEYCSVVSPIDGRAGQRMVDVGNVVTANQTAMLVVQTLDPIYADFTIAEGDLPVARQRAAEGTLKAQVKLPADSGDGRTGDLTFIDTQVQNQAGTVNMRATLPNADRHLWPGQFVNVRLILRVEKDAVLVPVTAEQVGQDGPYVYVVKPDKTAELRQVTLGQRQGDMVVLEKGVKAGENVITAGQMMVLPGGPVTVQPPPQQNPPAANAAADGDSGAKS